MKTNKIVQKDSNFNEVSISTIQIYGLNLLILAFFEPNRSARTLIPPLPYGGICD